MPRIHVSLIVALCYAAPTSASDVLPPIDVRFASADVVESPSFQRHVLPLFGRLGCNGRACHGSFQGQGGFRLSLFGYDFTADHAALAAGDAPRVDLKNMADSLILQKPTSADDHGGGERFKPASWQYRVVERWIAGGARPVGDDDAKFVSLTVEPTEIVFEKVGDVVPLRAVVEWSDGTREDVTPLCRFQTNDESVTTVDESGVVTCVGKGDTHVVAFYDNGVAPTAVLVPSGERRGAAFPSVPTPTKVDDLVVAKLRKLGIEPSGLCTDEEFLRRVSLDMTGTLPAPDEVTAFVADRAADKRARKIDELLERPTYAAWWTTRLCDWFGNAESNGPVGGEQGLRRRYVELEYDWINRRVAENVPYDRIVEGIVLGVGKRPEQSYEEFCAEMSAYFRTDDPADFTARDVMPFYWNRRTLGGNDGKALAFAYSFLGVRLECAQCHKHPFDQWTKQDFDEFSAFFNGVRYGQAPRDLRRAMETPLGIETLDEDSGEYKRRFAAAVEGGKVVPFKDVSVPVNRRPPSKSSKATANLGRVITPHLLGGEEVLTYEYPDPRQPLLDWMRQADNPYFARALVNRVWANYFHVGLIDPPDDMNLANPPSNGPLLDWLTDEFVRSGYDLKHLHRTIATSRTYQLSWRPNASNGSDERNYSRAIVRRLPAEVAYDAIESALAGDDQRKALTFDPARVRARAIGATSGYAGTRDENLYAAALFGKPVRLTNCDCERSAEPTLLQTVYLQNDAHVARLLEAKDGRVAELFPEATAKSKSVPRTSVSGSRDVATDRLPTRAALTVDELIDDAYLRTLSRSPTDAERAIATEHFNSAGDAKSAVRALWWALVNTKEFILNH